MRWCADWDSNPGPTDYLPLRLSQPFRFVVWTIPSPSSCSLGCSPSSLYTFPFGLGSGLASALPVKRSPNLGCVRQEFPLEASIQKSPILYLLSYQRIVVGGAGFEPAVSGIKTRCLTRLGEPPKSGGTSGTRTRTLSRAKDFKSPSSTVPTWSHLFPSLYSYYTIAYGVLHALPLFKSISFKLIIFILNCHVKRIVRIKD